MKTCACCLRGSAHIRSHRPCQDRFRVLEAGDRTICVISDGHGGSPHFRSGLGARILCAEAGRVLAEAEPDREAFAAIKAGWDRKVARHLDFRPLTEEETARLEGAAPAAAYGCTFVCAVCLPDRTVCMQLGDGEVHVLDRRGCFQPPMPEDGDCVGSATSSLCYPAPRAMEHLRVQTYPAAAAVLLYSDGYASPGEADRPYGLAALFREPETVEEHFLKAALAGDHGDDLTCIAAWQPALTEDFQQGLTRTLHRAELLDRLRPLRRRERQLSCYLGTMVHRVERSAPQLAETLRDTMRPKVREYMELTGAIRALEDEYRQLKEEEHELSE